MPLEAPSRTPFHLDSDASRRWSLEEASNFLEMRLDQGYEMQVTLHAIRPLDDLQWRALDQSLLETRRAGTRHARASDAKLLLWLRGIVDRGEAIGSARLRLLSDTLSVGLRTNAFEALIDLCERIGLGTRNEALLMAGIPTPSLINLQLKHVRLLKRQGSFSRALQTLAIAASAWAEGGDDELVAAHLIYGVAKAVGSHQNRIDQVSLLCGFGESRIRENLRGLGVNWRQFLAFRHPDIELKDHEALWRKLVDYRVKQQYVRAPESTRSSLLRQWDAAVKFEEHHRIDTGRARFARLLALAKTASSEGERESYLTDFEALLGRMAAKDPPDLRGMAIRHAQAAEIYLAAKALPRAGRLLDTALLNAERSSDWASVARAHLIRSDLLLQEDSPARRDRWEDALVALQRANDAVKRHVEPPLPLLLSSCSRQAHIALTLGDFATAKEHIHDALSHVADMRGALVQEDWTFRRADLPPQWLEPVSRLLTSRERALLQACAITDWDALVATQNNLVRQLEQASLLETNARIVSISSARVEIIRGSIAHDAANIVTSNISRLLTAHSQGDGDMKVVRERDLVDAQHRIDEDVRRLIGPLRSRGQAGSTSDMDQDWHSAADLCQVEDDDLEMLRMFAPRLSGVPVEAPDDFYLRCDGDLFRVMMMQFLLNAAKEIGTSEAGSVQIRVSWPVEAGRGRIDVRDSAGRVHQLESAIASLAEDRADTTSGRNWGLRHALTFFREIWDCKEHIDGEEGLYTVLSLVFPPSMRIQPTHP